MITIKQSKIVDYGKMVRLETDIYVDEELRKSWFEVDKEYRNFLCEERSDAFVIGLLSWAMRNKQDITCESPIGEELFYQITTFLIPSLIKYSKTLYTPKIIAPIDFNTIENVGAVGTGISCGIDSFHVLATMSNSPYKKLNLTHLVHNNVGSHGIGEKAEKLRIIREKHAEYFAREQGFKLVKTNSNFAEIFIQDHLLTCTYSSCFAIYMLQKLWKVYHYASDGYDFSHFTLLNNELYAASYYELLSLDCFSTSNLKIYSEGGEKTRFEKTKTVADYKPSQKYLNVCVVEGKNCGKCGKCIRTLITLDALDKLEDYAQVFDIDYYNNHRNRYLGWLLLQKFLLHGDKMAVEALPFLRNKIGFGAYLGLVSEMVRIIIRLPRQQLAKITCLRHFYRKYFKKKSDN